MRRIGVTLLATADGAPVFLEGVTTPSGIKDLLFVTTRDGRIIALDAQNGAKKARRKRSLHPIFQDRDNPRGRRKRNQIRSVDGEHDGDCLACGKRKRIVAEDSRI